MKRTAIIALAISLIALTACNTFNGMGEDVSSGGKAISDSATKTKEDIDNSSR